MNILVDAHVFDNKHQGTRTYLKGLYSQLIQLAPEWNFFMAAHDTENIEKEFGNHFNVTYLQLKHHNKFYRLLIELPKIIRKYKIDYSHFQYIGTPIKISNHKQIITIHDILFEQDEFKHYFPLKYRLINGFLFKHFAKRADVLLTVSNYSRTKISELYNIPIEKIYLTPNAVNNDFDEKVDNQYSQKHKELGKYILYVSRVEPRKNHLTLVKAFIQLNLAQQGYKLVFIGKKDIFYKELEDFVSKTGTSDINQVVWLDNVSNNDLANYYKNCELFVFPSFAEGFGIPPLEAMTFKRKLLCSGTTAMSDFGLPESATFNPHDVDELKEKIIAQLSTDFVLHEEYERILSNYNWAIISEDFKMLLQEHYYNLDK